MGAVLVGAALLKLASPRSSVAALSHFRVRRLPAPLGRLGVADLRRAGPRGRGRGGLRSGRLPRRRPDGDVRAVARGGADARPGRGALRLLRLPLTGQRARGAAQLRDGRRLRGPAAAARGIAEHRSVARAGARRRAARLRRARRRRAGPGAGGGNAAAADGPDRGARDPGRGPRARRGLRPGSPLRPGAFRRPAARRVPLGGVPRLPRPRAGDRGSRLGSSALGPRLRRGRRRRGLAAVWRSPGVPTPRPSTSTGSSSPRGASTISPSWRASSPPPSAAAPPRSRLPERPHA